MTTPLTMKAFFERLREALDLEQVEGTAGLDRPIRSPNISSPGLVLAGYVERFPSNRVQVFGETEMTYLATLSSAERRRIMKLFFSFPIPGAIITKAQRPSAEMVEEAIAAKPLADLDAKWAADPQQATNWVRMVYNSFKRS